MGTPLPCLSSVFRPFCSQPRSLQSLRFIFFSLFCFFSFSRSTSSQIPYSLHCSHIVPESTRTDSYTRTSHFLQLENAYVADGHQLLGEPTSHIAAEFHPTSVFRTRNPQILEINGTLNVRVLRLWGSSRNSFGRSLYGVYGGPRRIRPGPFAEFELSGFWSSFSGRLCMVGSGRVYSPTGIKNLSFNVVFKLNYLNNSVIASSLVNGRLESLDSAGTDRFFRPISVFEFSRMNYEYSLIKDEVGNNYPAKSHNSVLSKLSTAACFNLMKSSNKFEFDYGGSCGGSNCTLPDRFFGFLPKFMSTDIIDCHSNQFVRVIFRFSNSSMTYNEVLPPFDPDNSLIAEGVWNEDQNQLRFVACSISMKYPGNASVDDCSVRLSFKRASVLSIRSRSLIDGQMWSNKSVGALGYFDKIIVQTSEIKRLPPGLRYEFTEIERANIYCSTDNVAKIKGTSYPDPYSFDMKFDMEVKNDKKHIALGNMIPLFLNDHSVLDGYDYRYSRIPTTKHLGTLYHGGGLVNVTRSDLVNISYLVTFKPTVDFKVGVKNFSRKEIAISAEGTYNQETGLLCMVGCWTRDADGEQLLNTSAPVDCEIFIKVQFSHKMNIPAKGTIESKRQRTDPLYFEQLSFTSTSITELQVDQSIWRMDLEIIMVLISNTLACVFLGLQLIHVKSCPQALPFISVVMLVVLTLGHMVPLLLNFDALLSNRNRQNVFLGPGIWLEINEIVIRAITMIAFLLEARLLQLTWSSRSGNENKNTLWATEKKVFCLSLPLCLLGALMAWFLHPWKRSFTRLRHRRISRWRNLKAYAGLILDAFLFPQIILNIFCDSRENALAPSYYIGTTVVRLLPHAYDLFRAHSSALKLDLWYIYANPRMNFYSTTWDIIISCCGLLFAVVIYLQQRFGGRCVLPSRLRERYAYEKVPVVIGL